MRFNITRYSSFSNFSYRVNGYGQNNRWSGISHGKYKRSLNVVCSEPKGLYTLQQENIVLGALGLVGNIFAANYFYYDTEKNKSRATEFFVPIKLHKKRLPTDTSVMPKGLVDRMLNLISPAPLRRLRIEGDVYCLEKHSITVFSIIRNNEYVAVVKEDELILAGMIHYEINYSKVMKGKEHALLIMLLYFDNTFRRHIGIDTLYLSRKEDELLEPSFYNVYVDLANMHTDTWDPEETIGAYRTREPDMSSTT